MGPGIVVMDEMHAEQSQDGLVTCREMLEHFQSASEAIDDTRSHSLLGAQLRVGSSPNWSVFLGMS